VDVTQYDRLLFDRSAADGAGVAESDIGMSRNNTEVNDGSGKPCGPGEGPPGIMFGGDAGAVRGRGPAGGGGVVDLPAVSFGTGAAGVPATTPQADRTLAEGVEAAAGKELANPGSQTLAVESRPAVTWAAQRRLFGPAGECALVWTARLGQDPCLVCVVPGADPFGSSAVVHQG